MPQAYLDVFIEKDGSVTIDGQNFADSSCANVISLYKEKLGLVEEDQKKREFYTEQTQHEGQRHWQRG